MDMPQVKVPGRLDYPNEVYEFAETMLSEGPVPPTAAAIFRAIEEAFEHRQPPVKIPTNSRTVQGWVRTGRISRRSDIWSLASAQPGEPAAVLPVLAAVASRNLRVASDSQRPIAPPALSIAEAAVLCKVTEAAPAWDHILRYDFARFYSAWAATGAATWWLDVFLGSIVRLEAWTPDGLKRLSDAIAEGSVKPIPWSPSPTVAGADLQGAVESGNERRAMDGTQR
jgi:hypothetical protein